MSRLMVERKERKGVDSIEIPQTTNNTKGFVSYSELAYLVADSKEGQDYLNDMLWCQHYAYLNRETMLNRLLKVMQDMIPSSLSI
jgi:RNA-splicing ligase RtcB